MAIRRRFSTKPSAKKVHPALQHVMDALLAGQHIFYDTKKCYIDGPKRVKLHLSTFCNFNARGMLTPVGKNRYGLTER